MTYEIGIAFPEKKTPAMETHLFLYPAIYLAKFIGS